MPAVTTPATSMYLGEDKVIEDTIYQADGTTRQDITGWSMAAVLHAFNDPSVIYVNKTTAAGGITLTSPTQGVLDITVLAADTAALVPDMYQLSVRRVDSGSFTVVTLVSFELLQK